eukprot:3657090-Amphidinium_carterae.1
MLQNFNLASECWHQIPAVSGVRIDSDILDMVVNRFLSLEQDALRTEMIHGVEAARDMPLVELHTAPQTPRPFASFDPRVSVNHHGTQRM